MTTLLRCSILSILKLERLQYHPVSRRLIKRDLQLCLRTRDLGTYTTTEERPEINYIYVEAKKNRPIVFSFLTALAVILLCLIIKLTFPYPLHASCTVKWEFAESCVYVVQRLRSQIIKWSNYNYCGDKCLYQLKESKSYENDTVTATHFSLKDKVVDNMSMVLIATSNSSCTVIAESKANNWFSLFDDGRNYCNLRDLITGMEYDNDVYFSEFTSNIICTQYDMAYC